MRGENSVLKSAVLMVATLTLAPSMFAGASHERGADTTIPLMRANAQEAAGPMPRSAPTSGLVGISVAPLVLDDLPASAFGDRAPAIRRP